MCCSSIGGGENPVDCCNTGKAVVPLVVHGSHQFRGCTGIQCSGCCQTVSVCADPIGCLSVRRAVDFDDASESRQCWTTLEVLLVQQQQTPD